MSCHVIVGTVIRASCDGTQRRLSVDASKTAHSDPRRAQTTVCPERKVCVAVQEQIMNEMSMGGRRGVGLALGAVRRACSGLSVLLHLNGHKANAIP